MLFKAKLPFWIWPQQFQVYTIFDIKTYSWKYKKAYWYKKFEGL
jgi:hypothetical protein